MVILCAKGVETRQLILIDVLVYFHREFLYRPQISTNKSHIADFNDGCVRQKQVLVLVLIHNYTAGLSFVSGVSDLMLFRVYIRTLEMSLQVWLTDIMEPCTRDIAGNHQIL